MRKKHYLRSAKTSRSLSRVIFFDTETKPIESAENEITHKLDFGFLSYRRRYENKKWSTRKAVRFNSKCEFFDYLESKTDRKTKLVAFCHNTSFDLPVIDVFNELPARGWILVKAIIEAPPTLLTYKKDLRTIEFRDTLNIFSTSVEKLGETLHLKKLPFPNKNSSQCVWDKYCDRDVEIIEKSTLRWWKFLEDNDLGMQSLTTASQAFNTFKYRFMIHDILIDDDENALKLSRESYIGGRCEAYKIGLIDQKVTCLDVNSMYPFVMRENYYPAKLIGYTANASIQDLKNWLKNRCITARVILKTDVAEFPVRSENSVFYPVGTFSTVLTTCEIESALRDNRILTVLEVAVYTREKLFTEYIDFFYNLRLKYKKENDIVRSNAVKIMINSLYGKFGQNGRVFEECENITDLSGKSWTDYDAVTNTISKYRQLGGLVQKSKDEGESRESHPAIAAHVTAYARQYLWKLQKAAGRENVVYTDTDSIFVKNELSEEVLKYIDEHKLGFLKVEYESSYIKIMGSKDYQTENNYKLKACKKNALWLDRNTVEQERWSKLKGLTRNNDLSRTKTTKITKHFSRKYKKGIVDVTGGVTPFLFELDV